ncbi:uncharacterized protein [Typha latifolia]|uniref:uncharacterized protein isoform X2 n=1 Tax=Typha latifolia TaxID=4733 RepID=UPI003C2DBDDA
MLATSRRASPPSTGTSATPPSAPSSACSSPPPLASSWSAAAMPVFMSEDMVRDGYINIMNIDISSVVIEIMRKKYVNIPQMKYMQMDVRDMSFFDDESFDCVIDKGTLDSLMCGTDAPLSASQMLEEVSRLLKPGGIYMLITYGDPSVRVPRLNQARCNWKITLYIIPRPGFQSRAGCSSPKSIMEPVPLTEKGLLPANFVLEDPDSHYIYICQKMDGLMGIDTTNTGQYDLNIKPSDRYHEYKTGGSSSDCTIKRVADLL